MSYYQYCGINFHYEVEGAGPPLLFFHGLGGEWTQCKTLLEQVHGFSKVFMDVRGHGSTHPLGSVDDLRYDQFAQDAISLAKHLGHERFIAGGISMGSGIAINLALRFPHRIRALILIRPAWLDEPNPENLHLHVWIGELLQGKSIEQGKCAFLRSEDYCLLKETAPAVANSLLGQFSVANAKEYASRMIHIPASIPFEDGGALSRIRSETLIIATGQDPVHPIEMAEILAAKIPNTRFEIVTSKSEDMEKHLSEISNHIVAFLEAFRGSPNIAILSKK